MPRTSTLSSSARPPRWKAASGIAGSWLPGRITTGSAAPRQQPRGPVEQGERQAVVFERVAGEEARHRRRAPRAVSRTRAAARRRRSARLRYRHGCRSCAPDDHVLRWRAWAIMATVFRSARPQARRGGRQRFSRSSECAEPTSGSRDRCRDDRLRNSDAHRAGDADGRADAAILAPGGASTRARAGRCAGAHALLGENLIAFRDTSGRVGIMDHRCPHRCASLFFGRNEEDGLRCVYHGWKYDVDGQVPRHGERAARTRTSRTRSAPRPISRPSATASSGCSWATARRRRRCRRFEACAAAAGPGRVPLRAARLQLAAGDRRRSRYLACGLPAFRQRAAVDRARHREPQPRHQPGARIQGRRDPSSA